MTLPRCNDYPPELSIPTLTNSQGVEITVGQQYYGPGGERVSVAGLHQVPYQSRGESGSARNLDCFAVLVGSDFATNVDLLRSHPMQPMNTSFGSGRTAAFLWEGKRPLEERMKSEMRFMSFVTTVLETGALYYLAAAGEVSKAGPIGAASVVGVLLGIGADHFVGDVRESGRTLSDELSGDHQSTRAEDPTGRGTAGWRFFRDDVPDDVKVRSIRIEILWQKLITRFQELGFFDGHCEISLRRDGIHFGRRVGPEPWNADVECLNARQKDFLNGEGHEIALEMNTLRVEQEEDKTRREYVTTH